MMRTATPRSEPDTEGYAHAPALALSCEAHRIDWRQRVRHAGPAVALVLAHPQAARRRAEGEPFAGLIERESMAIHDIVGVRLRQALSQDIEGFAAVACARHNQLALARDAFLILDFRDKPRGVGRARMHDDREPERRRLDAGDLRKRLALVGGDEDAVVVLHPHALRRRRTLRKTMDILGDGVVGLLRRGVFGPHAFAPQRPACAAILGEPDAAGRDRDPHTLRITRVHADRMDAGQVGAAPHPLFALGMIPERADHVPALPAIARAEEPARQRSTPDDAGLVAATGLERPDACRAPIER